MSAELRTIEREALEAFHRGDALTPWNGRDEEAWVGFGLRCLLEAGRTLRRASLGIDGAPELKADGSPATRLERGVEEDLRARLGTFAPQASFTGEETGGPAPGAGFAVAVDPVDGTWGLLAETATWACVLAVLRDGEPFAGFIANPVTGELAYALRGGDARLLRLGAFGEPSSALTLPTRRAGPGPTLVCLHPHRHARTLRVALHQAWRRGELGVVRSPGGSPAWALVEAARGHFVYVNAWTRRAAEPYDLAAPVLFLRCAGGEVIDAAGRPIDATRHAGPWLGGIDPDQRARVAALVREAWPEASS